MLKNQQTNLAAQGCNNRQITCLRFYFLLPVWSNTIPSGARLNNRIPPPLVEGASCKAWSLSLTISIVLSKMSSKVFWACQCSLNMIHQAMTVEAKRCWTKKWLKALGENYYNVAPWKTCIFKTSLVLIFILKAKIEEN